MLIRNAMRVNPTLPGEGGTSYLERSPTLSRTPDYHPGQPNGKGLEKSAEAIVCAEQRVLLRRVEVPLALG